MIILFVLVYGVPSLTLNFWLVSEVNFSRAVFPGRKHALRDAQGW